MLRELLREYDHIVEIGQTEKSDESVKNAGHQSLIRRGRITESKWHLRHLEEANVSDECRLLYVGGLHGDLMIGNDQVEETEHSGARKCVQCSSSRGNGNESNLVTELRRR